jgi:hypothetical protein
MPRPSSALWGSNTQADAMLISVNGDRLSPSQWSMARDKSLGKTFTKVKVLHIMKQELPGYYTWIR